MLQIVGMHHTIHTVLAMWRMAQHVTLRAELSCVLCCVALRLSWPARAVRAYGLLWCNGGWLNFHNVLRSAPGSGLVLLHGALA